MITAGIDVGSTYTKVTIIDENRKVLSQRVNPTGFKLQIIANTTYEECLADAGLKIGDVDYVVATGYGRHQVEFKDVSATDFTASARGASHLYPATRTVLDIGGQTMKASRLDANKKVLSFRMNDKCAAGTGAFLEKTARYMGYSTLEIEGLLATSKQPASISGVCAVFAESEVINHLSQGTPPSDIMAGAIESLMGRSVQLIKRVKGEPAFTLIGGIMRFSSVKQTVNEQLGDDVNIPDKDSVQFISSLGAAILGQVRLNKIRKDAQS